jgi:hypothetical protein
LSIVSQKLTVVADCSLVLFELGTSPLLRNQGLCFD